MGTWGGAPGVLLCIVSLGAGCASKASRPDARSPVEGCRMVNVGSGLRYDCDGYTAAFHDAPPDAVVDARHDLDEMIAGLVEGFEPLRRQFDARIRVERSPQRIAGKDVLAAKVLVDHPTTVGMYYGAGYAVVAGRRGIICSASTGVGMERCGPVIRYLLEDR